MLPHPHAIVTGNYCNGIYMHTQETLMKVTFKKKQTNKYDLDCMSTFMKLRKKKKNPSLSRTCELWTEASMVNLELMGSMKSALKKGNL